MISVSRDLQLDLHKVKLMSLQSSEPNFQRNSTRNSECKALFLQVEVSRLICQRVRVCWIQWTEVLVNWWSKTRFEQPCTHSKSVQLVETKIPSDKISFRIEHMQAMSSWRREVRIEWTNLEIQCHISTAHSTDPRNLWRSRFTMRRIWTLSEACVKSWRTNSHSIEKEADHQSWQEPNWLHKPRQSNSFKWTRPQVDLLDSNLEIWS